MRTRAGSRLGWGRGLGVLSQLAGIGLLLVSSWLIVRAAEQPPVLYLMVAVVAVRFFGLARAALRYAERLLTHDAAFSTLTEARVAVHGELDRIAPAGLGRRRRGDLVNRVVSDVDSVLDRLLRLRSPWITALGSAAVLVVVLAWLVPAAAVVVAVQTVASMAAVRFGMAVHARRQVDAVHLRGELSADIAEAVRAAPDLVMAGATGPVLAAVRDGTAALGRAQRRGVGAAAGVGAAVTLLTGVAMAACALLTADIAPVLVGVAVLAPLAMLEPLEALADAERLRPEIEAGRRRLAELSSVATPVSDPAQPRALPGSFDVSAEELVVGWPDNVTAVRADPVSFELPAGGVMVVTGASGAGKSTLGLTMARLLDPVAGSLRLGGADVRDLRSDEVRSVVGVLAQDEIVFNTSIRENLLIADPTASDVDLWRTLAAAGIGRFVESLPRGLDTPVGEAGTSLSGGERQRLCLARLLLGEHRVIVVDEPTEHLDHAAGQSLVADLLALAPVRSVVLISHEPEVVSAVRGRGTEVRVGVSAMSPTA